jgi:DNA-binding PadR family transcriptional regulator
MKPLHLKILRIIHERTATRGKTIHDILLKETKMNIVSFYQLMVKLEDDGLVEYFDEPITIGKEKLKLRHYELTNKGRNLIYESSH